MATLAARFARYADLTLVTPHAEGFESMQSWVVNGALFESGRPILLLPKGPAGFPAVKRVMIAWDASVEASKAVRDAIGLMKAAEAVHAVLIDPVPSFEGHGPEPGADLAAYLGRHGIATTVHRLPQARARRPATRLRRTAADLGADLIVMGGFGHSRLRERIFGGTTTSMLKNVRGPGADGALTPRFVLCSAGSLARAASPRKRGGPGRPVRMAVGRGVGASRRASGETSMPYYLLQVAYTPEILQGDDRQSVRPQGGRREGGGGRRREGPPVLLRLRQVRCGR